MKNKYILAIGCTSVCLLAGCITPTPYQSDGLRGGYTQTQFDKDVFMDYFAGNPYTNIERTFDFTMLRSAEVCLEHGYGYFTIETGNAASSFGGSAAGILIKAYSQKPEKVLSFDAAFLKRSVKEKYHLQ